MFILMPLHTVAGMGLMLCRVSRDYTNPTCLGQNGVAPTSITVCYCRAGLGGGAGERAPGDSDGGDQNQRHAGVVRVRGCRSRQTAVWICSALPFPRYTGGK